ncbi:hypothetical protein JTB14_034539 [Gonioctena quinquepunctata]|nr:hypothetical protein JTB14_034539 [Gonioctena quinquepunctata]
MTKIIVKMRYSVLNHTKCNMSFLLPFFMVFQLSLGQDITNVEDIQVLSELSLEKLLSLRKAFLVDHGQEGNITEDVSKSDGVPHALALHGKKISKDRGGSYHPHPSYHYEEVYYKEDKSKVQTIFQISVTALAFLAFGGYLLCLLIHAIKGKQTTASSTNAVAQAMAAYLAARVKIKKKTTNVRRRPQLVNRPGNSYRRRPRPKRELFSDGVIEEDMYFTLLNLSEAYTRYHTIDYTNLNGTVGFY